MVIDRGPVDETNGVPATHPGTCARVSGPKKAIKENKKQSFLIFFNRLINSGFDSATFIKIRIYLILRSETNSISK